VTPADFELPSGFDLPASPSGLPASLDSGLPASASGLPAHGSHLPPDARAWAQLAPEVAPEWFLWPERADGIHGVGHIRRVYIHVLRLGAELGWSDGPRRLALQAALWHDLGRTHDGVEPAHGARSVERVQELGLADELVAAGDLSPAGLELVLFAIHHHSLDDEGARRAAEAMAAREGCAGEAMADREDMGAAAFDPSAALDVLWLLKDADALDRVRLGWGDIDPRYLRLPPTAGLVDFAWELLAL
jgi:hypothetical protein